MSLPDNVVIDYATDAGLRDALFTVILVLARTHTQRADQGGPCFAVVQEGMVRGSITVHDLAPAAWSPVELDSTSHPDGSMFTFTVRDRISVTEIGPVPIIDNNEALIAALVVLRCEQEKEGAAYNYKKSTAENYKTDVPIFVGPYAEIRAGLDYSFHPHYLPERQAIQVC